MSEVQTPDVARLEAWAKSYLPPATRIRTRSAGQSPFSIREGCGIRTREGLHLTRFPSSPPRFTGAWCRPSGLAPRMAPKTQRACRIWCRVRAGSLLLVLLRQAVCGCLGQGRLAFPQRLARRATVIPKMIATTSTTSFSQPGIRVGWVWLEWSAGRFAGWWAVVWRRVWR